MPRVSKAQAEQNRHAIEDASAQLFREKGINGVSVADVMAAAGLTHGGFYGHFESKDALAAAACAKAFEESARRWATRTEGQPDPHAARQAIVDGYLTPKNRDQAGQSCPIATFAGDVGREEEGKPVRQAYLSGIRTAIDTLTALNQDKSSLAAREQAMVQLSTLVGALLLARATRGDGLSDELLAAARKALGTLQEP